MPRIIPIRDLKNTSAISKMCQEATEPIYITKNGYGDMVIMSVKMYEEKLFMLDVYNKLAAAEAQISEGKVMDGDASLKSIRENTVYRLAVSELAHSDLDNIVSYIAVQLANPTAAANFLDEDILNGK